MYWKCYKVNFRRSGSYIYSPDWMKKKKTTINPKTEDDKCFQPAITVELNYREIESHPERASNIKPVMNKWIEKGKNCPSKIDNWKTFEEYNLAIALNIFSCCRKKNMFRFYLKN